MKASLNWLSDYVKVPPADELGNKVIRPADLRARL